MSPANVTALHKNAAETAVLGYAANHKDFGELLMDAAMDHLMADLLTDDLFIPDPNFTPTPEEAAMIRKAKETAALLNIVRAIHGL